MRDTYVVAGTIMIAMALLTLASSLVRVLMSDMIFATVAGLVLIAGLFLLGKGLILKD